MKQKISCFLIDEHRDSRNQFFLALDLLQISKACICFDNAEHALAYAAAQQYKPDYIFLHTIKPTQDGKNSLDQLRQLSLLAEVPVIFYAKSFHPDDMTIVKHLGAADWLIKQSDLYVLRNSLKAMFDADKTRQLAKTPAVVTALTVLGQYNEPVRSAV